MKMSVFYRRWGKFPWEVGYPHLQELYNILPFILAHIDIIKKKEEEKTKDKENQDLEYEKLKRSVHK